MDEYTEFINVASKIDSDDTMELPREKDDTVLLSTIQAQFPSAVGLKYRSSSGGWRGIRAEDNVLTPPSGGWGEDLYIVTESNVMKRKSDDTERSSSQRGDERHSRKTRKLLEDMIVLGLPFSTTEEEMRAFFTERCGEVDFCELKLDRETKKSRGFGFLRFKTVEGAEQALKGHHEINGRKLAIRLSKKRDEVPMKLFVGRLPKDITKEEVNDYFDEFGDMTDVFVPFKPFRGFAFITYADQEDAMRVLSMTHHLKGSRLHVTAAEPKEDKGPLRQENYGVAFNGGDRGNGGSSRGRSSFFQGGGGYDSALSSRHHRSSDRSGRVTSDDLKDMLMQLIDRRKR